MFPLSDKKYIIFDTLPPNMLKYYLAMNIQKMYNIVIRVNLVINNIHFCCYVISYVLRVKTKL